MSNITIYHLSNDHHHHGKLARHPLSSAICLKQCVPAEAIFLCRWDVDTGWFETVAPNKRFGSFVDDVEIFDNAFFGVAQPEAVAMDAQQRILLEASFEALQFSAPRELKGKLLTAEVLLHPSL